MNEVKQHGFLFKPDMVRANLRDVDPKTHTRRVITYDNSITGPEIFIENDNIKGCTDYG